MIAFDYEGTLSNHPVLRELVRRLKRAGDKPVIISAIKAPDTVKGRTEAVDKLKLNVPHYIFEYKGKDYNAGLMKAALMKKLKIDALIDNDPEVIKAVRDKGLIGLQI